MSAHEGTPVWNPAEERERNNGARLADDCVCPRCGARGFLFTCNRCEAALQDGAGR